MIPPPPGSTLFPYTTLFRSAGAAVPAARVDGGGGCGLHPLEPAGAAGAGLGRSSGCVRRGDVQRVPALWGRSGGAWRSEEHTSELQSHVNLVCRLLLEKKKR